MPEAPRVTAALQTNATPIASRDRQGTRQPELVAKHRDRVPGLLVVARVSRMPSVIGMTAMSRSRSVPMRVLPTDGMLRVAKLGWSVRLAICR
jgi:hypothetical protein